MAKEKERVRRVPPVENLTKHALRPDRKAQREFLLGALQDRQEQFLELLDKAAKGDPVLYMRLYVELSKLVVPRNSDVNVNLSLNKDFLELKALSQSGVKSGGALPGGTAALPDLKNIETVDFEEIGVAPFESVEPSLRDMERMLHEAGRMPGSDDEMS